jgi:hypothetical protein
VGEEELAGAAVVAIDRLDLDQPLDVIERLVDLVVHAASQGTVRAPQRRGSGLQLGNDHATVAAAGTPPRWMGVEHDD